MMTRALLLSLLLHAMLLWLALSHVPLPAVPAAALQLQLLAAPAVADTPSRQIAPPRAPRPAAAGVAPLPGKAAGDGAAATVVAPAVPAAAVASNSPRAADSAAASVAATGAPGNGANPAPAMAGVAAKQGVAAEKAGETREVRVRFGPKPPYPAVSAQLNEQGVVWLLIDVDEAGNPGNVQVSRSSGIERLDRAARNGVKHWRFDPALKDGQPQSTRFEVPVYFRLQ